ncbi:MAG: Prepilin leader peptidase/N-methyltransferase [Acidobacteriota bacterium]|nr:Prepilin leader peptidase/N-methyltransferase [Acidobacteriota bacterium]
MEKVIIIIFGLIVGSFLNVVIHRLPREQSIVIPGSHCPSCNTPIHFYDNIPVLSFLILMGKCRRCKARISMRYPLVELFTAFSFWLPYHFYFEELPVYAGFCVVFLCLLIALALIDLEHQLLPDELTLGGAVVFLIYAFFNPMVTPIAAIAASFGSALLFAGLYFFYLKVRKIEGLGQGDIKMMLLLGAFLGPDRLVIAVLLASFAGLLVGLFFIIFKGKNLKLKLPFGTFLSLGSYISLFWGHHIFDAIQSLYRI